MTGGARLALSILVGLAMAAAEKPGASLRGAVTDPSGAAVPGAVIQVRGPGGEQRATTDGSGAYAFAALAKGKYQVRVIARGFSVAQKKDLRVDRAVVYDAQLAIQPDTRVVNVEEELNRVNANPAANGGAVILRGRQLAILSDDPDELAQQLQALAGPIPGPGGAQFYIDGFLGGILPPKAAIREIRINANPFSPEYDRPGFARIEIFTKPGSDSYTLSTDLHRYSASEPLSVTLPQVMSKMLCIGMSLEETILKTTTVPAGILGREQAIGTLLPGSVADVLVFEVETGDFAFTDTHLEICKGSRRIVPRLIVKSGQSYVAGTLPVVLRDLYESDAEVFRAIG